MYFKKSILLFIIFLAGASAVRAQTINGSAFPVAGDIFTMTLADTAGFNTGGTGTNVNWNFGSLTPNGAMQVDSFMSPSSTPYGAVITNATVAVHEILPGTNYYVFYYNNTAAGAFQRVANIRPDTVIYSIPGNEFQYPLSYGSTENGTYYAKYASSGGMAIEAGTATGSIIGTGTLTNPFGTYSNVLCSHVIRNENDTVDNGAVTATLLADYYTWLQPNSYFPIMQYTKTTFTVSGHVVSSRTSLGYRQGNTSSAVNAVNSDNTGWMIFPNPASQKVTVVFRTGTTGRTDIMLHDMSGREIQHLSDENTSGVMETLQLNIENLSSGIYMVSIKNENGLATSRLEIAR